MRESLAYQGDEGVTEVGGELLGSRNASQVWGKEDGYIKRQL